MDDSMPEEDLIPPSDTPQGVEDFGVTAEEQRAGTPLEQRLDAEVADDSADTDAVETAEVGRLVAPDAEDTLDREPAEVATDVGSDSGDFSAEEAAIHLEE